VNCMRDRTSSAMKPKAYLLIFDGLADWEPAHAFCHIRKSGKFDVLTAGFSDSAVTSMGGLRITPQTTIATVDPGDTAFFMLPGGDLWQDNPDIPINDLLRSLHGHDVLIGAICAATLQIARAGLTHGVRHTSNAKSYLKKMVPTYRDDDFYVDELAVTDRKIVTASGLGSVEFAREVFRALKIYSDAEITTWYEMFKAGVMPAGLQT
jgi:putative intracellular protease/amidase